MDASLEELARRAAELTESDPPLLLGSDSPVLASEELHPADDNGFYLVGLIGGKEVGKSALVNALAGEEITVSTSHGRGTESAVAYVHQSQERAVRELLERETRDRHRVVTHQIPALARQVMLDLPDIDSHYHEHLEVTHRLLRHMLFPIWVSSVEKYADRHAQEILALVAMSNSPQNFLFVLNKADQISSSNGPGGTAAPPKTTGSPKETPASAALELRQDYAARIARVLKLSEPPAVHLVSAKMPDRFDFPELCQRLGQQKEKETVSQSRALAAERRDQTLIRWLQDQDLDRRAAGMQHLLEEVQEAVSSRIGPVALEDIVPQLLEDPATHAALAEDVLTERVAHWPMVNLVHAMLSPLFLLMRSATARHGGAPQDADSLVDASFRRTQAPLAAVIQSTFGQLHRSHPQIGKIYSHWRLWEQIFSESAVSDLSQRLSKALIEQRVEARQRLTRRRLLSWPLRWLLTVGALAWFPFLQPILEASFRVQNQNGWDNLVGLVITVFGVDYLLKSSGFLVIWFVVLWLALRWNTQRRVSRLMESWRLPDAVEPSINLSAITMRWIAALTEPARRGGDQWNQLAREAREASERVNRSAKAWKERDH